MSLLLATVGFTLAARHNARVELLPGTPVTVVITNGKTPAAAFILPITEAEARKAFGKPMKAPRNQLLEQLFEEDRQDALGSPDVILDQRRAYSWGLEDDHAS